MAPVPSQSPPGLTDPYLERGVKRVAPTPAETPNAGGADSSSSAQPPGAIESVSERISKRGSPEGGYQGASLLKLLLDKIDGHAESTEQAIGMLLNLHRENIIMSIRQLGG